MFFTYKRFTLFILLITTSCGVDSQDNFSKVSKSNTSKVNDNQSFIAVMPGYEGLPVLSVRPFAIYSDDDLQFFLSEDFAKFIPDRGIVLRNDGTIESTGLIEKDGVKRTYRDKDSKFIQITCNYFACTSLREDGSFFTFGDNMHGGLIYENDELHDDYIMIASTGAAFAALHSSGRVFAWGNPLFGGSLNESRNGDFKAVVGSMSSFVGLKNDGSIHCWGESDNVINCPGTPGYVFVVSNDNAFSAVTRDLRLVTWGQGDHGGSRFLESEMDFTGPDVYQIVASAKAFAVLFNDGSIIAYGDSEFGGSNAPVDTNFTSIAASINGFMATDSDGKFISWSGVNSNNLRASFSDTGVIDLNSNFTNYYMWDTGVLKNYFE